MALNVLIFFCVLPSALGSVSRAQISTAWLWHGICACQKDHYETWFFFGPEGVPTVECSGFGFVAEGSKLSCTCKGTCQDESTPTFKWLKDGSVISRDATLVRENVSREDNGREFICRMDCRGQTTTTTHVLEVSYGPSSDHMIIRVSGSRVVGGDEELTLTCRATEVNPAPVYTWNTSPCYGLQSDTCTFKPSRGLDRQKVTCKAMSGDPFGPDVAFKDETLDLQYPPPEPPLFEHPDPSNLTVEDSLSCKVCDGKPPVTNVTIYCPPVTKTQTGRNNQCVQTSLTIEDLLQLVTDSNITCTCAAFWVPLPGLYNHTAAVTFRVPKEFLKPDPPPSLATGTVRSHWIVLVTLVSAGVL